MPTSPSKPPSRRRSPEQTSRQRSARPDTGAVPRRTGKKRNLYKKSRYYRQKRRRMAVIIGAGLVPLLILLILSIRSCRSSRPAVSKNVSSEADHSQNTSGNSEESLSGSSGTGLSDGSGDGSAGGTEGESADDAALPASPVTITVSVVGDCTLGTDENFDYDSSLNAYFDSYGKDYFLENVKDIFSADDLTIANMEGTLTDSYDRQDKQFAFKAPPEFAGILSGSSVEAVNMANNHSHDYGDESFTDTLAALNEAGIVHFGYDETAVIDVKGVQVGLIGIYELNDHLEREEQLKTNIQKVKEEGADLTIVIFHWGNEKEDVPDSNQMTLGRMAIDEGADLVCGHHPHVLQGIEEYKGRNIVYSLGNFCFGGNSAPSDTDTMIFQQTFTIDADGVKKDNITNIIPCSITSAYGYNNYQPTPAEGDEKERIMQKIQERSSWINTP